MFKFFNSYTNYYLCTRIESFNLSFFDIKLNYLYTRSCDEEPYFLTLQNIENLYSIQDFQYQNRPIFLILAWLIYKFINLFNSDINQIFLFQLSYFILQNVIISLTAYLFNLAFKIKNTTSNYSITLLFFLLSPIYKWTIFEAGHHTQTGLLIIFGILLYRKYNFVTNRYLPLLLGILYLSHRSFVLLFIYCLYLIYYYNIYPQNKIKNVFFFSIKYVLPILGYQMFKSYFSIGTDHNIELYNQFFWVFDYIRGIDTYGVTGWYCQKLPHNFICYFKDNLSVIKYLYLPFIFVVVYLVFYGSKLTNKKNYLRPLFEVIVLVNIFWAFIGWYPPIRFSYYSIGHLTIFLSILIFYELNNLLLKITYLTAYISFFILHNHYNGDIYFQFNLIYVFSAIFYLVTLILLKNRSTIKSLPRNKNEEQ